MALINENYTRKDILDKEDLENSLLLKSQVQICKWEATD